MATDLNVRRCRARGSTGTSTVEAVLWDGTREHADLIYSWAESHGLREICALRAMPDLRELLALRVLARWDESTPTTVVPGGPPFLEIPLCAEAGQWLVWLGGPGQFWVFPQERFDALYELIETTEAAA